LVNPEETPNLANFDRWYERDTGERFGSYVLFRVQLKPLGRSAKVRDAL